MPVTLSDEIGGAMAFRRRATSDPVGGGSTLALLAAVRAHNLAWAARGRAVTSMTSESRFDEFHDRLEDAERSLLALARAR